MKRPRLRKLHLTAAILLATAGSQAALAAEWSSWRSLYGVPMSFKYVQVTPDTCALAFRNDSGRRLAGARLRYIHNGSTDEDILPGLQPGESLGGWSAFSVNASCYQVEVQVYDLEWE